MRSMAGQPLKGWVLRAKVSRKPTKGRLNGSTDRLAIEAHVVAFE